MSTDVSPPKMVQMVRLYTSPIVHIVDPAAPIDPNLGTDPERPNSLCKTRPYWPGVWIVSTDVDAPICKVCASVKEANERVG